MSKVQAAYLADGTRVEVTDIPIVWEHRCDGCGQMIDKDNDRITIDAKLSGRGQGRNLRADLHEWCLGMVPGMIVALLPGKPGDDPESF